jgi:hypothetical protein
VAASLLVTGEIEAGHTVTCEITLWRDADWADLEYTIRKPATLRAEAVYLAFPWHDGCMPLRAELVGGLMRPGVDQIPRSASDWHSIQDFVLAGERDPVGVWVTHDAPLVQFGDINTGKYQDVVEVARPLFYSWPMNNYWFTNFPAQQGGEFVFRYSVGRAPDAKQGRRFAKERTAKPRALMLPPGRPGRYPPGRAGFVEGCPCLQAIKPAENGTGFILRLRNLWDEPRTATVTFSKLLRIQSVIGVDGLERPKERPFTLQNGETLIVPLGPHAAADFLVRVQSEGGGGGGRGRDGGRDGGKDRLQERPEGAVPRRKEDRGDRGR